MPPQMPPTLPRQRYFLSICCYADHFYFKLLFAESCTPIHAKLWQSCGDAQQLYRLLTSNLCSTFEPPTLLCTNSEDMAAPQKTQALEQKLSIGYGFNPRPGANNTAAREHLGVTRRLLRRGSQEGRRSSWRCGSGSGEPCRPRQSPCRTR